METNTKANGQETADTANRELDLAKWNQPTWPASLDAVNAAPDYHKIVFENEALRLLLVVIPPGEEEEIHTHQWPSALWFSSYSEAVYTEYKVGADNQLEVKRTFDIPQLALEKAITLEPEGAHTVKNNGTGIVKLYRLEFKRP